MTNRPKNCKSKFLTTTEIKVLLLQIEDKPITTKELARRWKKPQENISRVINRTKPFLFPEIRQLLADLLGVDVSAVGRETERQAKKEAA